jgi:hypothetical protein
MKKVDKGGITYGKSHDEGGIPVKNASTGQMLEVEGGEGIVNKRSMASDKKVKINGKEMTICEAVSELNQMEGGVKFSCDDVSHRQFIEEMALGGELERGIRTEKEHIQTLRKLYEKRITPNKAVKEIAEEHLQEDPKYYSKLSKMESKMSEGGYVKKKGFSIYHQSLGKTLDEVEDFVRRNGYTLGEFSRRIEHINYGTTWRSSAPCFDESGKEVNSIHVQIFRLETGRYELNMYFGKTRKSKNDVEHRYDNEPLPFFHGGTTNMEKQEKIKRIAEMKKNFVDKAKNGKKVDEAPQYPNFSKYDNFFQTAAKFQENYKLAVAAHEKTVAAGTKLKNDTSIPKQEKEKELNKLRQQLVEEKDNLKSVRKDLATLPTMNSPFYAPKLAEGGQIVDGLNAFNLRISKEVGTLTIKPIKEDVTIYKLPKTGFTIDWATGDKGELDDTKFGAFIGKRSLGNIVALRMSLDAFQNFVKESFIKIIGHKSNYAFQFYGHERYDAIGMFINFLRFHGNSTQFIENYNPTTQSVYSGSTGAVENSAPQQDLEDGLDKIAEALVSDANYYSILSLGAGNAMGTPFLTIKKKIIEAHIMPLDKLKIFANGFVQWKKINPDFNVWDEKLKEVCFFAYVALKKLDASAQFQLLETGDATFKVDLLNSLYKQMDVAFKNFNNAVTELVASGKFLGWNEFLGIESLGNKILFIVYLIKK